MAPHLLSVSGEIRNMIYEYVLTEDDGVCYREDARGTGWLCRYHIGNDIRSDIGLEEEDSDDENFDSDDENFDSDNFSDLDDDDDDDEETEAEAEGMREAGTTPHSESDNGIQPNESANIEPEQTQDLATIEPRNYAAINQLQFVSRQLRNKTRGLALRYNIITFAESGPGRSAELCANFVQTLPTKQ
jgi:hypothetical protein